MNASRVFLFGLMTALSLAGGIAPAAADSVSLSTLLAGGTITEGDKVFSGFSAPGCPLPSATPCAYPGVVLTVVGTTDASGNYGIQFEWLQGDINQTISINQEVAAPPPTGPFCPFPGICDFGIDYTVAVLTPGLSISDAHLASDMVLTGLSSGTSGSAIVQETLLPDSALSLTVGEHLVLEPSFSDTVFSSASGTLGPVTLLHVQTQILLDRSVAGGTLSFIDETFSQSPSPPPPGGSAPEPDSMALTTVGFFAAALWFRRQKILKQRLGWAPADDGRFLAPMSAPGCGFNRSTQQIG